MAMSGMRTLTRELDLLPRTPPEAVLSTDGIGLIEHVPPRHRPVVEELAHWVYGGVGGAVFGALPPRFRHSPWAAVGLAFGTFAGYETVIVPVLGLPEEPRRSIVERAVLAADHLLYGAIVAGSSWPHRV